MKRCRWFSALLLVWSGLAFGAQGEVEIVHDPIECWPVDEFLMIQSSFVPPEDIQTVKFYFRSTEHPDYYYVELTLGQGAGRAIAPKADPSTSGVSYYIELVTRSFSSFRTEEHDVPVASGSECKRRDPETAYYTGENPDIAVGATRSGVPQMPPGFQSEGISRFMSVTGTQGGTGGGGFSGKTAGIIAGIGGGAGAALLLSGGGGSDPTTTSPLGGITTSSPLSSSTTTATGGVTSTTTTAGGGGASTSSATTTVIGGGSTTTVLGSTTTVFGSTTTVFGSSTTTVIGSSTTTSVVGSSTTTSVGTSSTTTTVVGSSTTTSVPSSSTTTSVGTSTTTSAPSTTTTSAPSTTTSAGGTTTTTAPPSTSSSTTSRASTTTTAASGADLAVTKSGSPASVRVNQPIRYTIRVTNNGPATATAVVASDTLPAGVRLIGTSPPCGGSTTLSCSLGTIQRGGVATLTVDVVYATAQPGPLVNRVNAFGRELDPVPGNNAASASTGVLLRAGADSEIPAVSYQTELTLERPRRPVSGFVIVNDAQVQQVGAGGPAVHRVSAEPGTNRFEAYLEPGAAGHGLWRFDFRGSDRIVPGSIKVESGRPVSFDDRSVVFALEGDTRIRFSVDFR